MHPILAGLDCSGHITKVNAIFTCSYFEVGVLRMDLMHKLLLFAIMLLYNHDNSVNNGYEYSSIQESVALIVLLASPLKL